MPWHMSSGRGGLKGFGGRAILELVDDFDSDTYRAVYTVGFTGVVYVLHAFQKKAKKDGCRILWIVLWGCDER
jgi:phage-related protein